MATARNTRANQMSSMELLWGTRSQPSRGPRPGLSVEKIAATAIEIADEDGIEAVSMQRIAGRLGYTAMSLYRYVPGKEQLIDISYDIALGQPSPVDDLTGSWRTEVTGWVSDVLAVYASHGAVRDLARTSVDLADGAERTGVSVEEMGQGYALAMKRFAESSDFPPCSRPSPPERSSRARRRTTPPRPAWSSACSACSTA